MISAAPIAKCPCGEHVRCIGAPGAWHLSHHLSHGRDCQYGGAPATITRVEGHRATPDREKARA